MPPNTATPVYMMWTQLSESAADFEGRYNALVALIGAGLSGGILLDNYAVGDGVTDDWQAIQNAIGALPATSSVIVMGAKTYKSTKQTSITRRGVRWIGARDGRPTQGGGSRFLFAPSAALQAAPCSMFQLGTSGVAGDPFSDPSYANANYGGPQEFYCEALSFECQGATTTALANAQGSYANNTVAVRDFFAGTIRLNQVWFEKFEYGFWGVNSDINEFRAIWALYCRRGAYFGPRSDQAHIQSFYANFCDIGIWLDGCNKPLLTNPMFVGCGSPTECPLTLSNGVGVATILSPWFEAQQGTQVTQAFVQFGGTTDAATTLDCTMIAPLVVTGLQTATPHAQYLARFGNANRIYVERLSGGVTNLLKTFLFTHATVNTMVHVLTHDDLAVTYDNTGAAHPNVSTVSTGYGGFGVGGTNGRFYVGYNNQPSTYAYNYTFGNESGFTFQLWFQNRNNDYLIYLRRRFWTQGSVPTGAPATGQTWLPGDTFINENATQAGNVAMRMNVSSTATPDWRPIAMIPGIITKGDADWAWTWGTDAQTVIVNAPLTANRVGTLNTAGVPIGAKVRAVRAKAATGAFTETVGGVALPIGSFADFEFDGAAWQETGGGTLP